MPFRWHPDESPPPIEAHSKAKLDVLRSYLRAYLDKLNVNPYREEFKLDLVDGFAGGGRCCMIQLRREWGRFSNFSFRTPQRRISAYPARPSG